MADSQIRKRRLLVLTAIVAVVILIVWIGSCGDDDADAGPVAGEGWAERADAFCSDGAQEVTALTLPATARQVANDAEARIEIVATVRDGIYTLGEPAELDPTLAAVYVDELSRDLESLDQIREAARTGGDYQSLDAGLDESAGETAAELGLDDCAAFAQAVARAP